jgi:UPF0716 protein FxsA
MLLLFVIFVLVPIAELYVIIQVGQAIGALWTILILIADSLIGARMLSWQGRRAWRSFQQALAEGRMPHKEVLDGALIILGGAFLLTPGFITDVFGLFLLIPPTRVIARRLLVRLLSRRGSLRWARVVARSGPGAPPWAGRGSEPFDTTAQPRPPDASDTGSPPPRERGLPPA